MQTRDLIIQIKRLPLSARFFVVEETLKSIKKEEINLQLEFAANKLLDDYLHDGELTAFSSLDLENFYEAT